jgi:uncharacterized membrane protein YuzA (DUF378 family)
MQFDLNTAVLILLIAGALNWGLVAFNGTDLVALAGKTPERYIKLAVGAAGAFALYQFIQKQQQ